MNETETTASAAPVDDDTLNVECVACGQTFDSPLGVDAETALCARCAETTPPEAA